MAFSTVPSKSLTVTKGQGQYTTETSCFYNEDRKWAGGESQRKWGWVGKSKTDSRILGFVGHVVSVLTIKFAFVA